MTSKPWTDLEMHEHDVTALAKWVDELRDRLANRDAEIEGLEQVIAGDDMAITDLRAECEKLRAEKQRLRAICDHFEQAIEQTWRPEVAALRARIVELEDR